ncbi:MAG TPA: class I SAM-dependent methyltransferase, partial [Vicinamibacterales bacterium]|nr:class I SAM-dependent methyltransferase [Vicinamibacterales bacterium]
TALERRHTANLTGAELTRALRALSSCYVERRGRLGSGVALEGTGKRAAFAVFYGPLHFLTITDIVRALEGHARPPEAIFDLGCGTGVGGSAWALACGTRPRVTGIDRSPWAAAEANWTFRQLGVNGHATTGDLSRFPDSTISTSPHTSVLLAYAVNELDTGGRATLLRKLVEAVRAGTRVLIVEAIALRDKPWWPEWTRTLAAEGARADEWRFDSEVPDVVRELARRAGLTLRELTARTISNLAAR